MGIVRDGMEITRRRFLQLFSGVVLAALLGSIVLGCSSKAKTALVGDPKRRSSAYQIFQRLNKGQKHRFMSGIYESRFISYIEDSLAIGLDSDQIADLYATVYRRFPAHRPGREYTTLARQDDQLIRRTFAALNSATKSLKNEAQLTPGQIHGLLRDIAKYTEAKHIRECYLSLCKKVPELRNIQILSGDHLYELLTAIAKNPELDISKTLEELPEALESLRSAGMDEDQIFSVANMITKHADGTAYKDLPKALDVLRQHEILDPYLLRNVVLSIPENCGSKTSLAFRSFPNALKALEKAKITAAREKAALLIAIAYQAKYHTHRAYDVLSRALAIQNEDLDVLYDDLLLEISRDKKFYEYGTPEKIEAVLNHPSFKRFASTYKVRFPNKLSIVEAVWEHINTGPIGSGQKVENANDAMAKLLATLEEFMQTSILDRNTHPIILGHYPYDSAELIRLTEKCGVPTRPRWVQLRGKEAFLKDISSPIIDGAHKVIWCSGIRDISGKKTIGPISAKELAKAIVASKDIEHIICILVSSSSSSFSSFSRDVYKELYEIQADLFSRKRIDMITLPFITGASIYHVSDSYAPETISPSLISALDRVHKDGTPLTGKDFFEAHELPFFEGDHEWMFSVLTPWGAAEFTFGDEK